MAVEPTAKRLRTPSCAVHGNQPGQGRRTDHASVTVSDDLADVMRATRSAGYDVFIGPARVAASALDRGYELVGANHKSQNVLVATPLHRRRGRVEGAAVPAPAGLHLHLHGPRHAGEAGLSFKDLKRCSAEKYPQAGLTALLLGSTDATVVPRGRLDRVVCRPARRQGAGVQPARARWVHGGGQKAPAELRSRVANGSPPPANPLGLAPPPSSRKRRKYKRVAGDWACSPQWPCPVCNASTPGRPSSSRARARCWWTRAPKEFRAKRMKGAVWAPYIERA